MDNKQFSLAFDLVANTSQSLFLTGKAGTGKTTFLRYVSQHVLKNKVVTAPTGIAAINAGGVTLHSFFQLPPDLFTPNYEGIKRLEHHIKFQEKKIELINTLELLIIDEISMVRADLLDAIDYVLKRIRNNKQPFGGVQMLFIGDLFQLPPVVSPKDWEILKEFYDSPLFFDSHILRNEVPISIELDKIYRQEDPLFVNLLNKVRNNTVSQADINILNQRYSSDFLHKTNNSIILTTHNYQADQINQEQLNNLGGEVEIYTALVRGEFNENAYPAEFELPLKENAQIMFIKNESGEYKRYYNGKIGKIIKLEKEIIYIECEEGDIIELERDTWKNIRYELNTETGEIQEKEIGLFAQFPIRLAWAVTIHKSQGLTFDTVMIDGSKAFAEGQVYVALSRCKSLEGITLKSKIYPSAIKTSRAALDFEKLRQDESEIQVLLDTYKPLYIEHQLKKQFDYDTLINTLTSWVHIATEKAIPEKEDTIKMLLSLREKAIEQQDISQKFINQISAILKINNKEMLIDRVQKASLYFYNDIQQNIVLPLQKYMNSIENSSKIKKYKELSFDYFKNISKFSLHFTQIYYGNENLTEKVVFPNYDEPKLAQKESSLKEKTQDITLRLLEQGKTVEMIAKERNLAISTIQSHVIKFVQSGKISAEKILDAQKLEYLAIHLKPYLNNSSLSEIKKNFPEEYSYFDLSVAISYLKFN